MQDLQATLDANNARVEEVREQVSRTTKEVSKLAREREREEARAKEVREGREAGDGKVDELCRWYVPLISCTRTPPSRRQRRFLAYPLCLNPDPHPVAAPAPSSRRARSTRRRAIHKSALLRWVMSNQADPKAVFFYSILPIPDGHNRRNSLSRPWRKTTSTAHDVRHPRVVNLSFQPTTTDERWERTGRACIGL